MNADQEARSFQLAFGMLSELRQEIVESIKLNFQITALKGTFIAGAITLFFANIGKVPAWIITIPVVSMVFFDALVAIRRFVIRRNSFYIRTVLEPKLKQGAGWHEGEKLWEQFLYSNDYKNPHHSFPFVTKLANFGLNLVFSAIAIAINFIYGEFHIAVFMLICILIAGATSFYMINPLARRI
jgi:hypothetical protein